MPAGADGAIELVADAMVTGFEDRGDSVAVKTADGRTFSGAALVAADGFRSLFRAKLIGDGEPRPTGYVAFRTIVPMAELKADVRARLRRAVGRPRPSHRALSAAPWHRSSTSSRCSAPQAMRRRGDAPSYRAELEHTYRDTHPDHARADRHDGFALAAARSPTAIRCGTGTTAASCCWATQRMRRCNRWRRAPAWRSRTDFASAN